MKQIAQTTMPEQKLLRVCQSAFPNGDLIKYGKSGMPKPELLPSNDPRVIAMRYQRAENEFNGSKSALRQARKILAQSLPLAIIVLKLVG